MRKSRFSEEQIIAAIKRMDAGLSAAEVGRDLGVNQYTLYRWKKRCGVPLVSVQVTPLICPGTPSA
jgi:putative transposase